MLDIELLQELLWAYGPCGQEDAVREICRRELEAAVDETWIDPAGNLIGLLSRRRQWECRFRAQFPIRILAHMDELSMLVKRVERGQPALHLTPLGTMYPANFGLGPVAALGDQQTVCGVLTVGSEHTTKESQRIWETKPDQGDRASDWMHVYVFTGLTPEDLAAAGVGPGTRICVERSKRTLVEFGDYLGSYFIDDRAAATALLQVMRRLKESAHRPAADVYAVFTTNEEMGGISSGLGLPDAARRPHHRAGSRPY